MNMARVQQITHALVEVNAAAVLSMIAIPDKLKGAKEKFAKIEVLGFFLKSRSPRASPPTW